MKKLTIICLLMLVFVISTNAQEISKIQKIESPQIVECDVTFSDGTNPLSGEVTAAIFKLIT